MTGIIPFRYQYEVANHENHKISLMSTCIYIYIYVRRKVRIGTIPELSCAKWEFSLCPPIPELYRTILELRKRYMLKIDKVCAKWELLDKVRICQTQRFILKQNRKMSYEEKVRMFN